jgi:hypothetical protein
MYRLVLLHSQFSIFNFQFSIFNFSFRETISSCLPPSLIVLAKVIRTRSKFYALMPVNLIKNVNFVAEAVLGIPDATIAIPPTSPGA